jgi:cell division protein FtsZ
MTKPPNPPHFLIIGCGGTGIRILDQISTVKSDAIRTVAIDSDEVALDKSSADIKIFLENNPITFIDERDVARSAEAILEAKSEIESLIEPSSIVFIIAGLGRGVGSGATPQIAKIVRDRGALVIATAILPYRIQDKTVRQGYAAAEELCQHADSVIVFDNERTRNFSNHLSLAQRYAKFNGMIADVLGGLTRSMTSPSRINLHPEDFDSIFRKKGLAMVLCGEPRDNAQNKNESIARECLNNPLLDIDYRSATGSIVLFTGGTDINGYDAEEIARSVTDELDPHADVVWCMDSWEAIVEKMKVYVIMTGIRGKG